MRRFWQDVDCLWKGEAENADTETEDEQKPLQKGTHTLYNHTHEPLASQTIP